MLYLDQRGLQRYLKNLNPLIESWCCIWLCVSLCFKIPPMITCIVRLKHMLPFHLWVVPECICCSLFERFASSLLIKTPVDLFLDRMFQNRTAALFLQLHAVALTVVFKHPKWRRLSGVENQESGIPESWNVRKPVTR